MATQNPPKKMTVLKDPMNSGHVSITATISASLEWLLWTDLTVYIHIYVSFCEGPQTVLRPRVFSAPWWSWRQRAPITSATSTGWSRCSWGRCRRWQENTSTPAAPTQPRVSRKSFLWAKWNLNHALHIQLWCLNPILTGLFESKFLLGGSIWPPFRSRP